MFEIDTPDGKALVTDIIVEFHESKWPDNAEWPEDETTYEHYSDLASARKARNDHNGLAVVLLEIDHDYPK